jgi:hypothetical protein
MTDKKKITLTGTILTCFTLHSNQIYAESKLSLTSGVDYSSGKYGQSQTTEITCIPFIAKYEFDNTTLKLTVPWLQITGPGDVVGGTTAPVVIGTSNRPITTESGLGDIVFTATQTILQTKESNPFILDVTGKVKFGTASAARYLGTGENDYTLELNAYKVLNKTVTLFGDIGYRRMGDSTELKLNNVWLGSAGLSYKLFSSTNLGIMADLKQATQNTSQPLRELTIFATHKFNEHYKLQSYLTHGYSDSSADWGGGVMLGVVF